MKVVKSTPRCYKDNYKNEDCIFASVSLMSDSESLSYNREACEQRRQSFEWKNSKNIDDDVRGVYEDDAYVVAPAHNCLKTSVLFLYVTYGT